jgi:hypothetical protein
VSFVRWTATERRKRMRSTGNILEQIGRTPLVALERLGAGLGVPILVKCEHLNPGGSIKDRIALAIVEDAEKRGALRPGMTLIEATAGNTGVGLALVAAARAYGLVCVMPEKMSVDKRVALTSLGAKVVITPNAPPSSPDNFRNVAKRMAEENGWFLTDQFRNPANVRVHEETTGAEILADPGSRRRLRRWRRHGRDHHGRRASLEGGASSRPRRGSPTRSARASPTGWRQERSARTARTQSRVSAEARRPRISTVTCSMAQSESATRRASPWRGG